jgi:predicted nucleotidyltransferase component of viral defense system
MNKATKNIAASVKSRLLNIAKESDLSFDYLLQLYAQERLLYRLSSSVYKTNFILKGGLLLYRENKLMGRTTKDIDFFGLNIPKDRVSLRNVFNEVIKMDVPDGIYFQNESIQLERIKEDADYEGIRVVLKAYIENSRIRVQLDIGFGDIVVNGPVKIDYPSLLDMDKPNICVFTGIGHSGKI